MRQFETADVFAFARLMKRIGLKEAIKAASEEELKNSSDLFWMIADLAGEAKCEQEMYKFLASVWECSADDVEHMKISDLLDRLNEMFEVNEMHVFFGRAAKLMKE